jgi:hypothetical protein
MGRACSTREAEEIYMQIFSQKKLREQPLGTLGPLIDDTVSVAEVMMSTDL